MVAHKQNGERLADLDDDLPGVDIIDSHRTTRVVTPRMWPKSDHRCFPTIRIVPLPNKPYLRATCRIRVVDINGQTRLEANLLDVGFWDSHEACFWQSQLSLTDAEAAECEAAALMLVV